MTRDYRPALRRLTVLLPKLIKASHVKKAYDLEKVITASFDFPSDLNALMGGMMPNHREDFITNYKNACFAAYEAGLKFGATDAEMPFGLYQEVFNSFMEKVKGYTATLTNRGDIFSCTEAHIKDSYKQGVGEAAQLSQQQIETKVPDKQDVAVKPSVEPADDQPVQPAVSGSVASNENPVSLAVDNKSLNDLIKAVLAKYESLRAEPKLVACLIHFKTGQPLEVIMPEVKQIYSSSAPLNVEDVVSCDPNEVKEALTRHGLDYEALAISEVDSKYVLAAVEPKAPGSMPGAPAGNYPKSLEEYAKLLGPGVAEQVLRTYLGMKSSATAATEDIIVADTALMCGPFNVPALKERLLTQIASHDVDTSAAEQVIVLDCIVSHLVDMSEPEKVHKIAAALQLPDLEADLGDYTLMEAMHGADMIAAELTHVIELPGNFVFVDVEGDYCLAYVYPTDTATQHSKISNKIATAKLAVNTGPAIPAGPQGALDLKTQKEIEAVARYQSLRQLSMKDIRDRAPTIAKHLRERLSEFQSNMVSLGEACDGLSLSIPNMVSAVFGSDGLAYLSHVQTEAKAAKTRKVK